jgi:hypothetical protein
MDNITLSTFTVTHPSWTVPYCTLDTLFQVLFFVIRELFAKNAISFFGPGVWHHLHLKHYEFTNIYHNFKPILSLDMVSPCLISARLCNAWSDTSHTRKTFIHICVPTHQTYTQHSQERFYFITNIADSITHTVIHTNPSKYSLSSHPQPKTQKTLIYLFTSSHQHG